MQPLVATALSLVGNDLLHKPIVVQVKNQPSGEVVITFSRPLSDTMVSPGRKPTKEILGITFSKNEIYIKPATFFENKEHIDDNAYNITQAAIMALSYAIKYKNIGNEFELEINKSATTYRIILTRIPYTPDSYAFVRIAIKGSKLELIR